MPWILFSRISAGAAVSLSCARLVLRHKAFPNRFPCIRLVPVFILQQACSWQEAFRDATAFASQNKRAIYHLYNSGNQETIRRYYHNVTLAAMTSYVQDQAEGLDVDPEDIRVLAEFYSAALSGLTALWLQGGMKYDVDAYIDHLGRLLDGNIRHSLEHCCRTVS